MASGLFFGLNCLRYLHCPVKVVVVGGRSGVQSCVLIKEGTFSDVSGHHESCAPGGFQRREEADSFILFKRLKCPVGAKGEAEGGDPLFSFTRGRVR